MTQSETESPRWQRKPAERPAQILTAALEVFSEHGLDGARMEDIAEAAGLSKATIYLYFPSKVDVFKEMIRGAMEGLVEAAMETEHPGPPAQALRSILQAFWQEVRSPRFEAVYRLVLAEVRSFPELAREWATEVRTPLSAALQEILDRGVAEGFFAPGDNAVRVRMLLALLAKHAVWCTRREFVPELAGCSDHEVLEEIMDFFFQALEHPATGGERK